MGLEFGDIEQATRARLLWDDATLDVAFVSRDTEMWALFTEEDDPEGDDRWRLHLYRIERGAGGQTHGPMMDPWTQMHHVRQKMETAADTSALCPIQRITRAEGPLE
jgi:hypothetical protein